MNQKLARLLEPRTQLFLVCLAFFGVCCCFVSLPLGVAELVCTAALLIYDRNRSRRRAKEVGLYVQSFTCDMDDATRDTMLNSPMPMVIFRPESGEVVWSNERFLRLTQNREHIFDITINTAVPGFQSKWLLEGRSVCPDEVELEGRRFWVFGHLVRSGGVQSLLATTYWVDITELAETRAAYHNTRPIVSILLVDNYDDLCSGVGDAARSVMLSEIDQQLSDWITPTGGLLCRFNRDRYLCVMEAQHFAALQEGKFSILESIHAINNGKGMTASLSIGVGRDGSSFQEMFDFASLSIEMALSRGGDQVVIKNQYNFEFFGGRARETEKRTKVKSRVMANALGELIAASSRVYIMGHKFPDLDSIGAAAGVVAIARKKGVPARVLHDPEEHAPSLPMVERLMPLAEYQDVFLSSSDALIEADGASLVVVVDTSRPEQVHSQTLLEACNRIAVIDHHRRAATYISNADLNFHEPYASSASELVTELLQYLTEPSELLREEAEALLSGIVLDTKNFTMRTGGRTFEAAAYLRRCGADTAEVRKLFQNDLDGTIARYDIIRTAQMYRENMAIAVVDHPVGRVPAAQAADELLNIAGIDVSFVLSPADGKTFFSARSTGDVNVQVILEKLGGGGNGAAAGAQVDAPPAEARNRLIEAIDDYFNEE